jgi:hypothetical protein
MWPLPGLSSAPGSSEGSGLPWGLASTFLWPQTLLTSQEPGKGCERNGELGFSLEKPWQRSQHPCALLVPRQVSRLRACPSARPVLFTLIRNPVLQTFVSSCGAKCFMWQLASLFQALRRFFFVLGLCPGSRIWGQHGGAVICLY